MKSFLLQFIFASVIILVVLQIAEAPIAQVHYVDVPAKKVVIGFVGDVMLGRNVEVLMNARGIDHPFASTSELFNKADFMIANLEGPIPKKHVRTKSGEMSFSFDSYVPALLRQYNIKSVSLANNHTYDKGVGVFNETTEALQNNQVGYFGHPVIQSALYLEHHIVNDISFTLLGFNSTFPSFDIEDAANAVIEAKQMFPEAIILVYMHWGNEYELSSSPNQKIISERLHDAGADLVMGAHPHVTQEISCQGIKRCTFFSIGNFIFDQYFSREVEQGLVVYVTITEEGIESFEIVPIEGNHSQPRIMPDNKGFMKDLIDRSVLSDVNLSTTTSSIILIQR